MSGIMKTEFAVHGEVKKTQHGQPGGIALPPWQRSEAAAAKIHELMTTDPFPTQDEIFKDPELMQQVEDAAREADIGHGKQKPKDFRKMDKNTDINALMNGEKPFVDDTEDDEDEQPQDSEAEENARQLRIYFMACARQIAMNLDALEQLSTHELCDMVVASGRRFPTFPDWIAKRY